MRSRFGLGIVTVAAAGCLSGCDLLLELGLGGDPTTRVRYSVNLPAGRTAKDTDLFNYANALTYDAVYGVTICDGNGGVHELDTYFVFLGYSLDRPGNPVWDVYTLVDGVPLDVSGGEVGAAGQYPLRLEFEADGASLYQQSPQPALTEKFEFSRTDPQTVELDFHSYPQTQFLEPFTVLRRDQNGTC